MSAKLSLEVAGKKKKKNHSFLVHRAQFGKANTFLPMNVLRRSIITYYSINFLLHKNSYHFHDAIKTVYDFELAFERVFNPRKKDRIQGSMELINYMPTDKIELESRRIWITDVYECNFFNSFVKGEIKNDLMERVIVNGMTDCSWRFKSFERITFTVTNINKKSIVS